MEATERYWRWALSLCGAAMAIAGWVWRSGRQLQRIEEGAEAGKRLVPRVEELERRDQARELELKQLARAVEQHGAAMVRHSEENRDTVKELFGLSRELREMVADVQVRVAAIQRNGHGGKGSG